MLIEKDTPGLSFGRLKDKMGLRGTSSKEMFFSDCRVPVETLIGKEGEGTHVIGKTAIGWGFFGAAEKRTSIQCLLDLSSSIMILSKLSDHNLLSNGLNI